MKPPLKVYIWELNSYSRLLQLTINTGKIDSKDYLGILIDFFEEQDEDCNQNRKIFQQFNSLIHTAGIISEFLANKEIDVLEWPSQFPDLSQIQNS